MPYYETVFMARQDLTEKQVNGLIEEFSKIITDTDGKVHRTEYWGLRTLAYKINKSKRAHYVLLETDCSADAVQEMERVMRLHDDVVRSMVIRQDELSTEPSVMMGGSDDSDDRKSNKREAA